jgi:flagellar basal body-associated protein FliL
VAYIPDEKREVDQRGSMKQSRILLIILAFLVVSLCIAMFIPTQPSLTLDGFVVLVVPLIAGMVMMFFVLIKRGE